jgi:quercetin dioxygenase-like cupin family protein
MQFKKWEDVLLEEVTPLLSRRLVWGRNIMVAHVHLKKGCVVPAHQHESEQVTQVLEGCLRLWVGEGEQEKEVTVGPGDVLVIPSMVLHRAEALEDTLDVDIFSPIRTDWLTGSDLYLRRK